MRILTTTVSLALLVSLTTPAVAERADHPARLLFAVSLIDTTPARSTLVSAGAGAHGEGLVAIARDATLPRFPRARAAALLGRFDDAQSRAGLMAMMNAGPTFDVEVRIQAISAYAYLTRVSGITQLDKLMRHADPEIRSAAARELARLDHPRATVLLQSRLSVERTSTVRATITNALRR